MSSTKKLTVYRRPQFDGARRSIPKVRQLIREIRERMDREQIILDRLVQDADVRRELLRKMVQPEPYLVD